jgi:hypothetical protein
VLQIYLVTSSPTFLSDLEAPYLPPQCRSASINRIFNGLDLRFTSPTTLSPAVSNFTDFPMHPQRLDLTSICVVGTMAARSELLLLPEYLLS